MAEVEETNRWGAVMVWESEEASEQTVPSRASELIGSPPVMAEFFEVEATVEGQYSDQALSGHGRALS